MGEKVNLYMLTSVDDIENKKRLIATAQLILVFTKHEKTFDIFLDYYK